SYVVGYRPFVQPLFRQRDKKLRWLSHDPSAGSQAEDGLLIGATTNRTLGGDDRDVARLRGRACGLGTRLDNAHDGYTFDVLANRAQTDRRGGITSDDQAFDAVFQQRLRRLHGITGNRLRALRSVGQASSIPE